MLNVIDVLEERGLIEAVTSEEARNFLSSPRVVYCGFDPTADSLHLGHLVGMMGLAWFQRCGHVPIALIGGATGMVGDPSGKSVERTLLDEAAIQRNIEGIRCNLEQVLDFSHAEVPAKILNNADWFGDFTFIDFLRDVGKHFRVGTMLAKDSVRRRMESDEGLSFTEFSYQLLQGYDFYHLNKEHGVSVQLGGSDQWGNITAGTDLVRRLGGGEVMGLTFPLLTKSDGKKFGKSEEGTVWLSRDKFSPYQFYQYLVRVPDEEVCKLLRMVTFLPMEEIRELERSMQTSEYVPNTAQKILARELTRLVHGEEGLEKAQKATEVATPGSQTILDVETLESVAQDMPSAQFDSESVLGSSLLDLYVKTGMQKSKGEARRLVRNGGAYLNNLQIQDENKMIQEADLVGGRLMVIGVGKKRKLLVQVVN